MIHYFSFENFPFDVREMWNSEIQKTLDRGIYISGEQVNIFEESFATYQGMSYAIGVGNGYDGLLAAIVALNLPQKSKIAVPVHTFIACWNAITWAGHIPVGVEVNSLGNITSSNLEALTENVHALLVVHMHGVPVDMESVMKWANQNQVKVIEDCSQAHGAEINGIKVGAFGDIGVFSFYPTKNLPAAGDAGGIVTNNKAYAEKIREFCNYGASKTDKYFHKSFGVNSRLDPIQAAVLNVNLKELDGWNQKRRDLAQIYIDGLRNPAVEVVHLPSTRSVYHHFIVKSRERDALQDHLKNAGIGSEIHYPRLASDEWRKITSSEKKENSLSLDIAKTFLSLPLYPWLKNEYVHKVIEAVNSFHSHVSN